VVPRGHRGAGAGRPADAEDHGVGLSAFLITQDEEHDLPDCLRSLAGLADEVVVVDSGSRDRTTAIARDHGARVIERPMAGFGAQKQFALEQASQPWALSIDADERVTPALAAAIRVALAAPAADGYTIRREIRFLGRTLRHGGLGDDWVLRLVRRDRARFTDAVVHERLTVDGRVARLAGTLEHIPYADVAEHAEKSARYSVLAAREQFARGRRWRPWHALRPGWEFVVRYGLRLGFLDGAAGYTWARLSAASSAHRMRELRALGRAARAAEGA
jgi:glycosyltransferase involved in cell wall biosynthesis